MASDSDLLKFREEIINSINVKDESVIEIVNKEIDFMEVTEGLNAVNNLESFYGIWKKRLNRKIGNKNNINSWTAYYVGLTSKKPDGEFLPLRRAFARAGFPDIDSDFEYFRRGEVIDHIINKYGRKQVGNIGTYGALLFKSATKRIGKAIDVAGAFHKGKKESVTENNLKVTEIVESLPKQIGAILKVKDEDGNEHVIKTIEDAYKYCEDFKNYLDKYPGIRVHAKNIEGLMSTYGVHASGVVISDIPLREIAPLRQSKKGLATQYANDDLESLGLIKFDILGLATMSIIQEIVKKIKETYGIDIDIKNLRTDDKKTLDLFASGRLLGVFQCDGGGMQETFKEVEASSFDDIMATIALYRPGPMVSIPEYCARKKGHKKVEYFHPSIEKYVKPYLERTYGVLVYQEQVMQICNSLAGFTISDGYVMIKGIGKKKQHIIDKFEKHFISGCVKNEVPENIAKEYWHKFITPFASYGFNASLLGETSVKTVDGNRKIIDIKRGDFIYHANESGDIVPTEVLNIHDHGEMEAFEITFDDGSTVVSSINHKFLTEDGIQVPLWKIYKKRIQLLGTQYKGVSNNDVYKNSEMRSYKQNTEEYYASSERLQDMQIFGLEKEIKPGTNSTYEQVWSKSTDMEIDERTSEAVFRMSEYQERKHSFENAKIKRRQQNSGESKDFFRYGEENFISSRNTGEKNSTIEELERKLSRKVSKSDFRRFKEIEEIENGEVVAGAIRDWSSESKVCEWEAENSRYCEREILDRSRRTLSLFRESSQEIKEENSNTKRQSGDRFKVEYGSFEKIQDAYTSGYDMLLPINGQDENRMVGYAATYAKVSGSRSLVSRKIVRIVSVGKRRLYDIEVASATHNFLLSNGIITSNSHSCCYALVAYITAYLKANFPDEFFLCNLNVECIRKKYDKIKKLEKDMVNFGIKLNNRKINDSDDIYKIVKKKDVATGVTSSEIQPSLLCKGMGLIAAKELSDNKPYKDLRDIAFKTKQVNHETIACLVEAGFYDDEYKAYNSSLGKGKKVDKEKFAEMVGEKFMQLRKEQKKFNKMGVGSESLI